MQKIKITIRMLIITFLATLAFGPPTQTQAAPNIVEPTQFSCTDVTEIPQIECEALVALYNETAGPNWDNTTGWLETHTPCSWYGTTCDEEHVVGLVLHGEYSNPFGLQGALPATIGDLTNLIQLDLSHNELITIPAEIGNLTNLIQLDFSWNDISHIPPEIGNFNQLRELNLGYNALTSLPDEIWNLISLTTLYLEVNKLDSLPAAVGNLTNLATLNLSRNSSINSLPVEIGNLTNLTTFECWNCTVVNLPAEIGNLVNLTEINLGANRLISLPIEIGSLTDLTRLSLGENQLSSLPIEIGNLINLTTLDLWGNQLSILPTEIGNLNRLASLHLRSNQLSSLPTEIGSLTNLGTLDLTYNRLVIPDNDLSNFLTALDPDWAATQTIPPTDLTATALGPDSIELTWTPIAFQDQNGYYAISVAEGDSFTLHGTTTNKSDSRYVIDGLTSDTAYNIRIRTYTPAHNGEPSYAGDDQSNDLWSDYSEIVSATTLELSAATPTPNQTPNPQFSCTNVTEIPQSECKALVALYNETAGPNWDNTTGWLATHTPCNWYGVTCVGGNIEKLVLAGTPDNLFGLQGALPAKIGDLRNLTELDLRDNQLSSLPAEIGNLKRLIRLFLSNNQLGHLPPEIGGLSKLGYLYLETNQLSDLPVEMGNLANLIYLFLIDNQLSSLPAEIGNLNSLTNLRLQNNLLSSLPTEIGNLDKLITLRLTDNLLSSLPAEMGNLNRLDNLWLDHNQLVSLPPSLANLTNMVTLYLEHNRLTVTDAVLRSWMNTHDPDWAETQSVNGITPTLTHTSFPNLTPVNTPLNTPTPKPTVTNTPRPTATPRPLKTPTNEPTTIPSPTPPPNTGPGDIYESDDECTFARQISTDGISQRHTFHDVADTDWVYFRASHSGNYQILVDIPFGSSADVDFAYYTACDNGFEDQWNETYAPGLQLTIEAEAGEVFYIELTHFDAAIAGDHVAYDISVQALSDEPATGAVILVAGRLRVRDPVQENMHNVTLQMYELFQGKGVKSDDIMLLSTDSSMDHYYAAANLQNLEDAITQWAVERVSSNQALTLYIMTHGEPDELYIDRVRDQILTPALLDGWLTELEAQVPDVEVNIIIEACHSGSFIQQPQSISSPERLVMTSTDPDFDAFASRYGAHFTDNLIVKLGQGENVADSFDAAVQIVDQLYSSQNPWLDVDGDGIPNEAEDQALASVRGFRYVGSFGESWPPFIAQASPPATIDDRRGRLYAEVRDDTQVESVWAVIYPPDYVPPAADGELNPEVQEIVLLQRTAGDHKDGDYYGDYTDFDQDGTYQVVIQARDRDGLMAQPLIMAVEVEILPDPQGTILSRYAIHLPIIVR